MGLGSVDDPCEGGHQRWAQAHPLPGVNCRHQQYLYKVLNGYCGIGGTNVKLGDPSEWGACQTGLTPTEK